MSGPIQSTALTPRPWLSGIAVPFLKANLRFACSRQARLRGAHRLTSPRTLPDGFFGICVASNPDPACDDYVIRALHDLGIRQVRLDYTFASEGAHTERFLHRLRDADFRILLHLVQPPDEARAMAMLAAQERWRDFVARTLDRHGAGIELVEIGATCNRRAWCGCTLAHFLVAWEIAHGVARARGIRVAAPNVTDFEPPVNIGLLALAARLGILPDVHTDNLFAERATEPESYDHKILGRRLAPLLKVNTVKKAVLLKRIAAFHGVPALMCTHVAWSERRIRRMLPDPWHKQADYLQRYLCLMAAAEAFDRVYWGPLIGQREGLVDDGTREYPELPHVTLYERAPGRVADYRRRPAFDALRTVVTMLAGARFVTDRADSPHLHILAFAVPAAPGDASSEPGVLHVVWTTNGYGFDPADWYGPDALATVTAIDRDGAPLVPFPRLVGESPVFLRWPAQPSLRAARPVPLAGHRFFAAPGAVYRRARIGRWHGLLASFPDQPRPLDVGDVAPETLETVADRHILRDTRNTVWACRLGGADGLDAVVKRSRVRSTARRLLDHFKPSRPVRSWSASCELLRRGIRTPRPIACFESAVAPHAAPGYFVCEAFPADGSVRQAFHDFARGADAYLGIAKADFYGQLAGFVRFVHDRGCFFRDLSSGNVLMRKRPDGVAEFALIDTTRARFFPRPIPLGLRISDLKRICHRLTWPERQAFLACCFTDASPLRALRIRLAFGLYDLKHALKQRLRRKRPHAKIKENANAG